MGHTSLPCELKEARFRACSLEVPQTVGVLSTDVIFEPLQLVASCFALGKDMVTSREVLRAVALFG